MRRPRLLELFCGIGGCSAALGRAAEPVAAVDIHRGALAVLEHNFSHPTLARNVESLQGDELAALGADLWWMSPPCQPYTRRGLGRELDDPRARCLLPLLAHFEELRPAYLGFENVPGFELSRTRGLLLGTLERAGYAVREGLLCPSELGLPNRRRRYYLLASRRGWAERADPFGPVARSRGQRRRPLASFLEPAPAEGLHVPEELLRRYEGALDIVEADDPEALTACFTSAYGRSPVRSGSYLRAGGRVRRFSPREVLALLGFPSDFELPAELPRRKAWRLVGNSLSLPTIRRVLSCLPPLARSLGGFHGRASMAGESAVTSVVQSTETSGRKT